MRVVTHNETLHPTNNVNKIWFKDRGNKLVKEITASAPCTYFSPSFVYSFTVVFNIWPGGN